LKIRILANFINKILAADYHTPKFLSESAKDFLKCILNVDPEKRYTIDQIRQHEWYKQNEDIKYSGIIVGSDQIPVDERLLNKWLELGHEGDYALKWIEANKHNSVTATYNLLLKKAIREGEITIKDAYECKTDIIYLLRRNPRFRKINDKVHNFFHFDKNRKSNSLQPNGFMSEVKKEKSKSEVRNEYLTIQKDYTPPKSLKNGEAKRTITTGAPSLLGIEKKQNLITEIESKPPRLSHIKNNQRSIKNPPLLDNINIISPTGIPVKANTSKWRASRRMKSNESKRSQNSSKNENTINTQELAQFFEYRISKKDQFRKNQHNKKFNSFIQK